MNKAERKNILYPGRIEKHNLGDILINGLLIRELLKYSNVFIKGNMEEDLLQLISHNNPNIGNLKILNFRTDGLVKYKLSVAFYLLKNRSFDYVFDTPGHIAEDKNPFKTSLKALFNLISIIIYEFLGIKSVKYGITLGPFNSLNWKLYRLISKRSKLIVIRDQENYKQLISKKFSHIELKPDLSFLLNDLIKGYNTDNIVPDENLITLSFRGSLTGKDLNNEYFDKITENLKKLILILKSKYEINQVDLTYQVDCDRITAEILKNKFENEFDGTEINFINKQLSLHSAFTQYSKSRFVITNRLHVFLFAMMFKTITFIITDNKKHTKLTSILNDLGLQDLIFKQESIESKFLSTDTENFNYLSEINSAKLSSHLNSLLTAD